MLYSNELLLTLKLVMLWIILLNIVTLKHFSFIFILFTIQYQLKFCIKSKVSYFFCFDTVKVLNLKLAAAGAG